MNKNIVFLLSAIILSGPLSAQKKPALEKRWETDSVFKVPESVLYDKSAKVLYVANIDGPSGEKDGKGSIGKLGTDGKVIAVDWVSGLEAPKGMAKYKNRLWVADLDHMVVIDIDAAKILRRIKIDGAVFLNDVTVDNQGTVYVSDSRTKKVHKIEEDQPSVHLEDLQGPNGLLFHNGSLYVLDNGNLYRVEKDKKLHKLAGGMESSTDGIEHVKGNEFIVSCWSGVVYYVHGDGTTTILLDTRATKTNSADIGYDAVRKIVYVPTFFGNTVAAYQLK